MTGNSPRQVYEEFILKAPLIDAYYIQLEMGILGEYVPYFPRGSLRRNVYNFIYNCINTPLIEELVFRSGVQNFLGKMISSSPRLQILLGKALFSSYHLGNEAEDLSRSEVLAQVFHIISVCPIAITYYTIGGLVVPLVAHMTHNTLALGTLAGISGSVSCLMEILS